VPYAGCGAIIFTKVQYLGAFLLIGHVNLIPCRIDFKVLKLWSCNTGLPSVLNSMDSSSIASNIEHYAEFKPFFAPEQISPLNAYYATAKSVFDALLINWNATYNYYDKMNVKQAYYLSMEFLQVPQPSSYLIIYLLLIAS